MRRALAGVALAVTSMVALSFLIPLALLVRSEARSRVTTVAEQRAAALAPVLAITTRPDDVQQAVAGLDAGDHLSVHLPDGQLIGSIHAPARALKRAARERETMALDTPSGWVYLQPVILARERVAVVEAFVPREDLNRGVGASWAVMSVLALGLVGGSVLVADRLGARVVRASQGLSRASHALGKGDLEMRVEPGGPPELHEAGQAFNAMADRVVDLLAMERELVADLSHRLRTPLTALHLESERISSIVPGHDADRLEAAIASLDNEIDSIITAARTPLSVTADSPLPGKRCEVSALVGARVDFWSVLAAQQGRECRLSMTTEATPVLLPEEDLAAVVDALIGNVFRHTPQGSALAVSVERTAQAVVLTVDDAGPGINDPDLALARGVSVGGSTGLGLDIAHRAASSGQGRMEIGRGPLGGARVRVVLGLAPESLTRPRRAARRERRRRPPV
ncbi:sensor histidine kinase [Wenjunlia tyrosinilytica]|uniref:histidine kinase n=1 Tax=Wenjunlia tyrosinilytica TaxID=1544741 RepID=A0A917ZKP5_9ACTN|nr:HAMP domain-containing sensor histidine kinase [Wenjunlia tyrosinilytica]GGO85174.1 two-component sensor histidine kinase [Wenjunlia tyrosinilytica]